MCFKLSTNSSFPTQSCPFISANPSWDARLNLLPFCAMQARPSVASLHQWLGQRADGAHIVCVGLQVREGSAGKGRQCEGGNVGEGDIQHTLSGNWHCKCT